MPGVKSTKIGIGTKTKNNNKMKKFICLDCGHEGMENELISSPSYGHDYCPNCDSIEIQMIEEIKSETKTDWMTVKEYADKHGCSVQNIYPKIRRGTVKFKKIGSVHLVK